MVHLRATAFALLCIVGLAPASGWAAEQRWLERHPDTALRVMAWNVDRAFFRDNAGFQRVLRAVDADLLILDEMPAGVAAGAIANGLPAGRDPWDVLYGTGGGPHQRASIAARRPLRRVAELDDLAYPRDRFDRWLKPLQADRVQRALEALEAGVAAVAGVIDLKGRRLLVVGVDLQCCGDSEDGPEEDRQQFEARAIREAIDRVAITSKVDAVLIGGDLNTVNGDAPLRIIRRAASPLTSVAPVDARHRGSEETWTWDGRGTPFPSRQIDYVLHSDHLLVLQAQVFDTEDLQPDVLAALELVPGLSRSLSPHRPVVVDIGWRAQ